MKEKTKTMLKYLFGLGMLLLGLIFEGLGIGSPSFETFGSVGMWLIYIGLVSLLLATVRLVLKPKKRIIDERMEFVAAKAMRTTFVLFIMAAFAIMIIDGIQPIQVPMHLFMSYLVCFLLVAYFASYKLLLRRY